jgi:polyhydroxyalkanoate synthesis regulator phasin
LIVVVKKGVKSTKKRVKKPATQGDSEIAQLEQQLSKLTASEMKELLLMNMYKLAMVRSQLDAVTDVLVKKKLTTTEQLWKETHERFSGPEL